jgi:murein DD-endopeptidase MepM/ murein hydrolase activator NlpD
MRIRPPTHNHRRKVEWSVILCGLLCILLMLVPASGISQTKSRSKSKSKKSVGQLRGDLARLRKKKEALRTELRTTKRAAKAVLADIGRVDAELTDVEGKLAETGQRLGESKVQQKVVATELGDATAKLAESKEQVRKRIRRMYMQGDSNLLTALVGTGDVGEIASRQFVLQRIAEQDKKVFLNYYALRDRVKAKKSQADELVHRVATLLDTQKQAQGALKNARVRKGSYLQELRERQGEIQDMLNQFESDERSIAAEIRAFQRRRRKPTRPGQRPEPLPPYRGGRFAYPVSGRITSNFGMRYHPILHITRMHAGCDFGAPIGATIRAVAPGEVIHASYMRGYGNVVIVDHGGGLSTVYAHCSRIGVSNGQQVKRGQSIANVGSTGLSTGPHLHFEVRVNGRAVNPRGYL